MKDLIQIGTAELLSLPLNHIFDVPAKVDTGADSSAIWASHISERGNSLSFVLFDEQSPHYTGVPITTADYKMVSVKNSFGESEFRYKVRLKVVLGGRKIMANFTLANRSASRYPILIGRKTLHGKFVVDVMHKAAQNKLRILMLSTKRTEVTQKFADNIAQSSKRLEVDYASYEDLDFMMGLPESRIVLRATGQDIAGYDMVYFKTTAHYMDIAAATACYLEKRAVPFVDEAIKHFAGTSKLYQYMLFEKSLVLVPKSVFMLPAPLAGSYDQLTENLGLPFVVKDIHGNKGEHNYLVNDKKSFARACAAAASGGVQCVAQEFIANDDDYRVLVFGKKIRLVIKRTRVSDKTHLNNTSKGSTATIVDAKILPPTVQKACLQAARLVERQMAGVDIVQDKRTGMWYCLEVNDGPQLASGSFVAEKHIAVAKYLERKLT